MPENESDPRIRDLFEAVHAEDRPPTFDRVLQNAARRPRRSLQVVPVAVAVLLVLAVGWLVVSNLQQDGLELSEEEAQALAESFSTWQGPTDFLLDTPGSQYFESVPVFDIGVLGNGVRGPEQEVLQ